MTARRAYRAWCRKHVRTSPGFTGADAAIAELEAENERIAKAAALISEEKEKAEDGLAALKVALAERGRMLRLLAEETYGESPTEEQWRVWLANLRARAEEGNK